MTPALCLAFTFYTFSILAFSFAVVVVVFFISTFVPTIPMTPALCLAFTFYTFSILAFSPLPFLSFITFLFPIQVDKQFATFYSVWCFGSRFFTWFATIINLIAPAEELVPHVQKSISWNPFSILPFSVEIWGSIPI